MGFSIGNQNDHLLTATIDIKAGQGRADDIANIGPLLGNDLGSGIIQKCAGGVQDDFLEA